MLWTSWNYRELFSECEMAELSCPLVSERMHDESMGTCEKSCSNAESDSCERFGTDLERNQVKPPRNRSIPGWLFRHDAGQSKTQTYFDDKIVIKIVEDAENAAFNIAASYCFFKDSD